VSATVKATTAMGAVRPVEFTSTANRTASRVTARHHAAVRVAYAGMCIPTTTPAFMTPAGATPAAATPEFSRMTPVVPRASTDEDASDKVVGTVEAVRRASIGIVIVVSVRAGWRSSSGISWTNSDPYADSNLRL